MIQTTAKKETLVQLAKSKHLYDGQFKALVKQVLQALTADLEVSHAGFWMFHPRKEALDSFSHYDAESETFALREAFSSESCPRFYELLRSRLIIKVDQAQESVVTKEIKDDYIRAHHIQSMLGIQVWNQDALFGVLLLEQTRVTKRWLSQDKIQLTAAAAYLSQSYGAQMRIKAQKQQVLAEANYHSLFNNIPLPLLIYDPNTWKILDANASALAQYDYNLTKLKQMTMQDLLTKTNAVDRADYEEQLLQKWESTEWQHQKKDGTVFFSKISGDATLYHHRKARIALVIDATQEKSKEGEKEALKSKLQNYAFYVSYNVKKPLSSINGLMTLIKASWDDRQRYEELMTQLRIAVMDLEEVVSVMQTKLDLE